MKIFDLEQDIANAWNITEDVSLLFHDSENFKMDVKDMDALQNRLLGLQYVYEARFNKLWRTFEEHTKEFHKIRKQLEELNAG